MFNPSEFAQRTREKGAFRKAVEALEAINPEDIEESFDTDAMNQAAHVINNALGIVAEDTEGFKNANGLSNLLSQLNRESENTGKQYKRFNYSGKTHVYALNVSENA